MEYKPKYKKVHEGSYLGFLESEIPEFIYVIKSGYTAGNEESHQIYYVITEEPYEPAQEMIPMTKFEIEKKYNIKL